LTNEDKSINQLLGLVTRDRRKPRIFEVTVQYGNLFQVLNLEYSGNYSEKIRLKLRKGRKKNNSFECREILTRARLKFRVNIPQKKYAPDGIGPGGNKEAGGDVLIKTGRFLLTARNVVNIC